MEWSDRVTRRNVERMGRSNGWVGVGGGYGEEIGKDWGYGTGEGNATGDRWMMWVSR